MWAWIIAVPMGFMLLVLTLARLEETIVAPVDRAVAASSHLVHILERSPPHEVEELVAQLLAPIVPSRKRVS
jgi:hypothetical protein